MTTFIWILSLLSFLLGTFLISYRYRESIFDSIPVSFSMLLLLLYFLAFFRALPFASLILILGMTAVIIFFLSKSDKSKRGIIIKEAGNYFLSFPFILTILVAVFLIIISKNRVSTWWDDLNFWATDAKSLYFLGGFPGKYGNVAPEFGDYPPGMQLGKWCIMSLSSVYNEGLSFSGYYVSCFIFLLPLLKRLEKKNPLILAAGFLLLLLIPGVCNCVWAQGTCADVFMGIIYGALLMAIIDFRDHSPIFYYARIALYMSILTLSKSVGFEWAFFAAVLFLIVYNILKKDGCPLMKSGNFKYALLTVFSALFVQGLWWSFCLFQRRIAKLTSSGVRMASRGYSLPDNAYEKAVIFLKAFIFYPMHTDKSIAFDISSFIMLLIFLLLALVLWKKGINERKIWKTVFIFTIITALISYGIIFIGHISIFQGESQYDTADVMAISISRYAAPFTIGMLMLFLYALTEKSKGMLLIALCGGFILLTTDYPAVSRFLFTYEQNREADLKARLDMIDDAGNAYIKRVDGQKDLYGHRVLYLRDSDTIHWIKDTYINFMVSPVPTIYDSVDMALADTNTIIELIRKNHPEYIYVDPQEEDSGEVFDELMKECSFKYGTIYRVISEGERILLTER